MADNQMMHGERRRRSKLDPYVHLVGKLSDREVASMAGMTPDGVRMYRQRHDIPPARSLRRAATPSASQSGLNGYLVTVSAGETTADWILLASDLAEAAEKAASALGDRADAIESIRFLARAL
jgi:hypothetical protein